MSTLDKMLNFYRDYPEAFDPHALIKRLVTEVRDLREQLAEERREHMEQVQIVVRLGAQLDALHAEQARKQRAAR